MTRPKTASKFVVASGFTMGIAILCGCSGSVSVAPTESVELGDASSSTPPSPTDPATKPDAQARDIESKKEPEAQARDSQTESNPSTEIAAAEPPATTAEPATQAEEQSTPPSEATPADTAEADPLTVPEGKTPAELFEFIDTIQSRELRAHSQEELQALVRKTLQTIVKACDKILVADATDEESILAVRVKSHTLRELRNAQDPDAPAQLTAFITELKRDKRPGFVEESEILDLVTQGDRMQELDEQGLAKFADSVNAFVKARPLDRRRFGLARSIAEVLSQLGQYTVAAGVYRSISDGAKASDNPEMRAQAAQFEGTLRRLELPGKEMTVEGTTLAGEKFDWASYRGKVVLVDFWATWCGPCLAELPNVRQNYELYHDKGFDVVGISLDEDQAQLAQFLEQEKIPWVTLFSGNMEEQGWKNPTVQYYGISGIPAVILVDKEGKVISLNARGPELGRLLEQHLGPATAPESSAEGATKSTAP